MAVGNKKGFAKPEAQQRQATQNNAVASNIETNRQTAELNLQGALGLAGHTVHDTMHQLDQYVDSLTDQASDVALQIVHPDAVRGRFAGKLSGKLQSLRRGDSRGFSLGSVPQFSAPPQLQSADFSHLFPTTQGNNSQQLPSSQTAEDQGESQK